MEVGAGENLNKNSILMSAKWTVCEFGGNGPNRIMGSHPLMTFSMYVSTFLFVLGTTWRSGIRCSSHPSYDENLSMDV